MDTLILEIYVLIIKTNVFRGDLSDISAKTATLACMLTLNSRLTLATHSDFFNFPGELTDVSAFSKSLAIQMLSGRGCQFFEIQRIAFGYYDNLIASGTLYKRINAPGEFTDDVF